MQHVSPLELPGSSLLVIRSCAGRSPPRRPSARRAGARRESNAPNSLYAHGSTSSARCEVSQVRWRLVLPGRRKIAIVADRVDLLAQRYILIVVRAKVLDPFYVAIASIAPRHGPRTGERMIDRRDLVVEEIRVALVEIDALLDDRLVVLMQRNAAVVECARSFQAAGLDLERV